MKNSRSILTVLFAVLLLPACEDSAVQLVAGPPEGGAMVKFFNFSPASPGVNFYVGDTKVTAISTTTCVTLTEANEELCTGTGAESTTGVNYGGAAHGASGWYSDLPTGQQTIRARIAAATDKNLPITSLQANLASGTRYSFYVSAVYDSVAKSADSFIVEDQIPTIDHSVAYVRFVNAVADSDPMTLYATNRSTSDVTAVGGAVAYATGGTFTALEPGAYDLATRAAGSATDIITRANVSFSAGRVYTIGSRGDVTGAMALDNTANH